MLENLTKLLPRKEKPAIRQKPSRRKDEEESESGEGSDSERNQKSQANSLKGNLGKFEFTCNIYSPIVND